MVSLFSHRLLSPLDRCYARDETSPLNKHGERFLEKNITRYSNAKTMCISIATNITSRPLSAAKLNQFESDVFKYNYYRQLYKLAKNQLKEELGVSIIKDVIPETNNCKSDTEESEDENAQTSESESEDVQTSENESENEASAPASTQASESDYSPFLILFMIILGILTTSFNFIFLSKQLSF